MGLEFDGVNGIIKNSTSDGDVTIKGNDGGSEISLLAFDVSAEGVATFNSKVGIKDSAPDVLLHVNQGAEPPAEGMFILEANSASRQLRMQPPTNSDNGFIDYRGGNLTFLDDGTEVARFQGTTGFGIGTSTVNSKLEVAGNATITTADNTDTLTLTSTDGDASVGPNLRLYRNSSSPADGDQLAKIDFEGRNDNSQDVSYFDITSYTRDVSDGTEDGILLIHGIKAGSSVEYIRIDPHADHNGIVFNDGSTDMDFRVETNDNSKMFFVDGGNDAVIFNGNTSDYEASSQMVQIHNSGLHFSSGYGIQGGVNADRAQIALTSGASGHIVFKANNTEVARMTADGYMTKPLQPAFSVQPSSNQTNLANNDTIVFGTEIFDQNADFASNTFTAPVTGKYLLSFMVRLDDIAENSDYAVVDIVTSNREYLFFYSPGTSDEAIGFHTFSNTLLCDMDANDTAKLTYQEAGGTTGQADVSANNSRFTGVLIC